MRIITVFIFTFFLSPVDAEMYKCIAGRRVSYQDSPCQHGGSVFFKKKDISVEQQKAAVAELNKRLDVFVEKKKLAQKVADKERQIRAEENNAYANYQAAKQTKRQTEALEKRNEIEQRRLNNLYRDRIYIDRYPRFKPFLHSRHKSKLHQPTLNIKIKSD